MNPKPDPRLSGFYDRFAAEAATQAILKGEGSLAERSSIWSAAGLTKASRNQAFYSGTVQRDSLKQLHKPDGMFEHRT